VRLAMYLDQVFWKDGQDYSTDESYILFPSSFTQSVDEIEFIGRGAPTPGCAPYVLQRQGITVHSLPYYSTLWKYDEVLKALPSTDRALRRIVRERARYWDAILIDGPHPIGQLLARRCIAAGVPIVLMVRQNLIEQMRAYRGVLRGFAVAAAGVLEWDFRRLARGRTVFTVGMEMAREYARFSKRVHNHFPCLVNDAQFRQLSQICAGGDPRRLLCVCRLAPEKGHDKLLQAMQILCARGVDCHLDVAGSGLLGDALKARVHELGIAHMVTFHGYVPYGPQLFALYQNAGVFVLPSFTEGFPQVINESLCIGLPTIATAVGGIPAFLSDGETAILVPPGDVRALADAIERLVVEAEMRRRLSLNGQELMSRNTLEANRSRVLGVIRDEVLSGPA